MRAGVGRCGDRSPLGGGVQRRELRHRAEPHREGARRAAARGAAERADVAPRSSPPRPASCGTTPMASRAGSSPACCTRRAGRLGVRKLDAAERARSSSNARPKRMPPNSTRRSSRTRSGAARSSACVSTALAVEPRAVAAASLKRGGSEKSGLDDARDDRAGRVQRRPGVRHARRERAGPTRSRNFSPARVLRHRNQGAWRGVRTRRKRRTFFVARPMAVGRRRFRLGGGGERRREDGRTFSNTFSTCPRKRSARPAPPRPRSRRARPAVVRSAEARRRPRVAHVANIAWPARRSSTERRARGGGGCRRRRRAPGANAQELSTIAWAMAEFGARPFAYYGADGESAYSRMETETNGHRVPSSFLRARGAIARRRRRAAAAGDDARALERQAEARAPGLDGRHRRGCPGAPGPLEDPRAAQDVANRARAAKPTAGGRGNARPSRRGRRRAARARVPRGAESARLGGRDVFGGAKPTQKSLRGFSGFSSSRERHVLVAAVDHGGVVARSRSRTRRGREDGGALVSSGPVGFARVERARLVRRRRATPRSA